MPSRDAASAVSYSADSSAGRSLNIKSVVTVNVFQDVCLGIGIFGFAASASLALEADDRPVRTARDDDSALSHLPRHSAPASAKSAKCRQEKTTPHRARLDVMAIHGNCGGGGFALQHCNEFFFFVPSFLVLRRRRSTTISFFGCTNRLQREPLPSSVPVLAVASRTPSPTSTPKPLPTTDGLFLRSFKHYAGPVHFDAPCHYLSTLLILPIFRPLPYRLDQANVLSLQQQGDAMESACSALLLGQV
ncbi:hypothetical protein CORC01_07998 [Colletotrichum orchidophilum]|uniref:Uncharacterized protein n=1 Tax=Colletotrichum orchidophilum TaxID=1209926 RepID=A0A1G4B5I8_9PEZI|nr:uncharacterized protein CORC01_07998 [Colletotrichum orchidophilum]OHE96681.1 hypothetical protein CORC01_07998 [Colletotrichum orchidophilum]